MHMKWPHGTGREAGIGRTRNGKELSAFRACPWWLALRKVAPRWSKRVGPLKIIVEYFIYYINTVAGKVIRPPVVFPV